MDLKALAQQLNVEQIAELLARRVAESDRTIINDAANDNGLDIIDFRADLIEAYQTNPASPMTDTIDNYDFMCLVTEAIERVAPEYKLPSDFK